VPAFEAVMAQVAVATLDEPLRVVVDVVQPVIPAVPETAQVTDPDGVAPLVGPVIVAVKVTLLPSVVGVELMTLLVGVALPTVIDCCTWLAGA
jgi:hypothetical protein